jgi:RNA polymerase sigma factor (TIGR02999 family)
MIGPFPKNCEIGKFYRARSLTYLFWERACGPTGVAMKNEVTSILSAIEQGEPRAAEQLLPLVYGELRKLAAQRLRQELPGQTLQATALVHEAYIRLVDNQKVQHWNSRGHFFAAAAEAMRRIVLDRARKKRRLKHGGGGKRVEIDLGEISDGVPGVDLLALDEALKQLELDDPVCASLVKLRYFGGLGHGEAALALDLPRSTADRYWAFARAWLFDRLRRGE